MVVLVDPESLMVHEVTVLNQDGVSQSSSGEVTVTYSETATTMYLEPTHGGGTGFSAGREEDADRNTPIGDWMGVCRVSDGVISTSRILYGEHTFDVIAPPRPMPDPELGTIPLVELSLQEIT